MIIGSMDTVECLWDLATGKMMMHMHHKKNVCAQSTEYSLASVSVAENDFKKWKCPGGTSGRGGTVTGGAQTGSTVWV